MIFQQKISSTDSMIGPEDLDNERTLISNIISPRITCSTSNFAFGVFSPINY